MAERRLMAEIKNDPRYFIFPWQTQNTNNDIKIWCFSDRAS